uniref:Uncharacterized protein n=1 Tax=Pararge aegeria TaxID=116150 RepID=S4NMC4_9NEOP
MSSLDCSLLETVASFNKVISVIIPSIRIQVFIKATFPMFKAQDMLLTGARAVITEVNCLFIIVQDWLTKH